MVILNKEKILSDNQFQSFFMFFYFISKYLKKQNFYEIKTIKIRHQWLLKAFGFD